MLVLLTLLKKQTRTPSNPELLGGEKNNSRNNNNKKTLYLYTFILTFSKSTPPYPRQKALTQEQLKKHNLIKHTTVAYYDKYKTMKLFKVETNSNSLDHAN